MLFLVMVLVALVLGAAVDSLRRRVSRIERMLK